jgi:diguanylate cyclase (GGDEF)-like protein
MIAVSALGFLPAAIGAAEPWDAGLPFVRAYEVPDGLPQNTVHALWIGRDGRFWAGTQDGLASYDGRAWTDLVLPTHQRSNFVRALLETSDGALWVGTQAGGLLRRSGNVWTVFGGEEEGGGPGDVRVNALAETGTPSSPVLWVATHSSGLVRYDGHRWQRFTAADGLPADRVWDLLTVSDEHGERLWVATEAGPAWLELPDGPIVRPEGAPTTSASSLGARVDEKGRQEIWVGLYGGGLAGWTDEGWRSIGAADGLPSQFLTDLAPRVDDPQLLWVATDGGGLAQFDGRRATPVDVGAALSSSAVYKVLETGSRDGAAAVWLGSRNDGLLRVMTGFWRSFVPYSENPRATVSALMVSEDAPGGAELWLGTDGFGAALWKNGTWRRFTAADGSLGRDAVLAIAETRAVGAGRRVWVGTRNGGLSEWDGRRWRRHDRSTGALPNDLVQTLFETVDATGRGTLWVGTREGLARFDGRSWEYPDAAAGWPASSILALAGDPRPDGGVDLWIGSSTGLHRAAADGTIAHWGDLEGLPNPTVHALLLRGGAGKRELWVGTDGGGAAILDPDEPGAKLVPIERAGWPSLPNGVVYAILEDRFGRLYLPTNRGVVRLSRDGAGQSARLELMTVEHGLPSSQANRGAAAVDARGRIWIGTVDGAAALDPAREPETGASKRLLVAGTLTDGSNRDLASGARLAHDEARMRFRYTLLSFFGEPLTRYRTQLAGHDGSPTEWSASGEREFGRLPPGDYVFRVWGRDADDRVSGPAELAFTVLPAPWQTLGARLGMVAALALGVLLIVRARARVHERREHELEELVAARTARLARANALLIELSYVDAVTSIPNRRRFDELMVAEWKRSVRAALPLAVVMIDIDWFKDFNDSYGHQRGDDCLRQVAAALADGLSRSGDAISRYGGEEFAVILPATDLEGAVRVAEQLRRRVQALGIPNQASQYSGVVTVSCGVAAIEPNLATDAQVLVAAADRALYEAKKAGRNRVVAAR